MPHLSIIMTVTNQYFVSQCYSTGLLELRVTRKRFNYPGCLATSFAKFKSLLPAVTFGTSLYTVMSPTSILAMTVSYEVIFRRPP